MLSPDSLSISFNIYSEGATDQKIIPIFEDLCSECYYIGKCTSDTSGVAINMDDYLIHNCYRITHLYFL